MSVSRIFISDSIAHSKRRQLLRALLGHNPQEEVVIPDGVPMDDTDYESLRLEMYHRHLPMLEEQRLIDWDRDTHEVVKGPQFEEIKPLLECLDERYAGSITGGR